MEIRLPVQGTEVQSLVREDSTCCRTIKPMLHNHSEKVMAPHSSTLAWRIPWTEEPGRLQSMGSLGVGHD